MTGNELVTKAEQFASNFVSKLGDKTEQPERKQIFFMENQDELRKCMGALQKTITSIKEIINEADEEELELLNRAETVVVNLKACIEQFQKELAINSDVQEEDVTPALTEETIGQAMKTNKTTQEITENMNAIAEHRKAMSQVPQFNYAMCCDGTISLIAAYTKEELNNEINTIANQAQYKNIQLFELHYTPIPLKQKTVLSI